MNINITIIGQIISFIIFVLFCMKYIWVPIILIIEKRQKEISNTFASIEQSKKISEDNRIKAVDYLERAKIDAKLIVEQANQYRIQLIDQVKLEAKIEQKKILSQAYDAIRIKKKCVIEELQKEMSKIIISGVEKIIDCPLNRNYFDHAIVNKIINELLSYDINMKNHDL